MNLCQKWYRLYAVLSKLVTQFECHGLDIRFQAYGNVLHVALRAQTCICFQEYLKLEKKHVGTSYGSVSMHVCTQQKRHQQKNKKKIEIQNKVRNF